MTVLEATPMSSKVSIFKIVIVPKSHFLTIITVFIIQVDPQRAGEEPAGAPEELPGEAEGHRAAELRQLEAHHAWAVEQGQTFH